MGKQYHGFFLTDTYQIRPPDMNVNDFDVQFWDNFLDQHPPGSNFTVYYNPNDPSDWVLQPGVQKNQFKFPITRMPITAIMLMLCFQPILETLSAKGKQLPVFAERRSVKDKSSRSRSRSGVCGHYNYYNPVGTSNLEGNANEPDNTSESEVYCIRMKRHCEIELFFAMLILRFTQFFLGAFLLPVEFSLIFLCSAPLGAYWMSCNNGDSIELDTKHNIFRHKNLALYENGIDFGFIYWFCRPIFKLLTAVNIFCRKDVCIKMNQVKDIHLQMKVYGQVYSDRYTIILVYHDEDFDPDGLNGNSNSDSDSDSNSWTINKEHVIIESMPDEEAIEFLTLLLKSDPCLKLPAGA